MRCPACLAENLNGFAFCKNCGSPLLVQCPLCGLENEPEQKLCRYCGEEVSGPAKKSFLVSLEGEKRFVVTLFADIVGFTHLSDQLDAESATTLVNRCLDEMTKTVAENGGRLVRYTGDGLLAVFGAPRSHENDPERALRTALKMREVVNKIDFGDYKIKLHIGIACGVVVAGGVGSEGRKEYNIIGHSVNLASRLEEVSEPDQILVNEEMVRLTNHLFSFTAIELPPLRGVENEARAFELNTFLPKTAPLKQFRLTKTPFIGRAVEFEILQKASEDLKLGYGKVISILGEAGIGKSRILYELYTKIKISDSAITCLFSNATEVGGGFHYSSFYSLLKNAIGLQQQLEIHDMSLMLRGYLEEVIPNYSDEVYPFFALIMGIPIPRQMIKHIEWLKKEDLEQRISMSIIIWLRELTKHGPVVLLFDNMHWVDEESASIFEGILSVTKEIPILLVCTTRPDINRAYLHIENAIKNLPYPFQIKFELTHLSLSDTEHMIQSILGDLSISKNLVDAIYKRSEGNPLYIEEYIQSLLEQNILTFESSGHWKLAHEWDQVPIPPTIQGILQSRIDRLDLDTRRVLQIAATNGQKISLDILSSVSKELGIGVDQLSAILGRLLDSGLIENSESLDNGYQFKHICIRDTVYNNMLKQNKADLHLLIANWYEKNTLHQKEPPYATIIYHLENTDEIEKKRLYLVKAGYQATRYYSNKTARNYFNKALALITNPSARFELLLAREKICNLIGDLSQQKEDLDEMIRYSTSVDDDATRAKVFNRLAIWHESLSDYIAAKEAFLNGIEAARRVNAIPLEAENLHHLASTEWRLGNYKDAIQHANSALELSQNINDNHSEAISLTTLGVIYRTLGDIKSALLYYEKALEIRRRANDRRGEAINLSQLGNVHYDMAHYWEALILHKNAVEIFKIVGDRRGEAWSLSGVGTALLACGDHETALTNYQEALSIRRSIGDRRGEGVVLADLGNTLLAQGDLSSALNYLRASSALLEEVGSRRDEVHTLKYLAYALELTGQFKEAASKYRTACKINSDLGINEPDLDCEAGLARIVAAENNHKQALNRIESISRTIKSDGITMCEFPFRVYLTILQILRTSGRHNEFMDVLSGAQKLLLDLAEKIEDRRLRELFLSRTAENAEILKLWQMYIHTPEIPAS